MPFDLKEVSPGGVPVRHWGPTLPDGSVFTGPIGVSVSGEMLFVSDDSLPLKGINLRTGRVRTLPAGSEPELQMRGIVSTNPKALYAVDVGSVNRVLHFASSDTTAFSVEPTDGAPSDVYAIAVDRAGNIYITDILQDEVRVYSPHLTLIRHWGGSGSSPGRFRRPHGSAVDGAGRIFVVDTGNNRVQEFGSLTG